MLDDYIRHFHIFAHYSMLLRIVKDVTRKTCAKIKLFKQELQYHDGFSYES